MFIYYSLRFITCNLAISNSKHETRPGGIPIFLAMAAAKVESSLWMTDSCVAGVDDRKLFEYRRNLLDTKNESIPNIKFFNFNILFGSNNNQNTTCNWSTSFAVTLGSQ